MTTANYVGYRRNVAKGPILRRAPGSRPASNATEIFDTDFESDESDYEGGIYDSSRWSAASLADSVTTVSTSRDVQTPDSGALSAFHFHVDDRPVLGPKGPHLFRSSMGSDKLTSTTYEADFVLAKTPTASSFDNIPWNLEKEHSTVSDHETLADPPPTRPESINAAVSALDETRVRSWSPSDVVQWMREAGFDDSVVEKFLINDISGAILLDLQPEDLKELDIRSFGKRRNLMNSIQHLRDSFLIPQTPLPSAQSLQNPAPLDYHSSSDSSSTTTKEDDSHLRQRGRYCPPHMKQVGSTQDFVPNDVGSIVAIEQVLPRPHHCSKGRNCRKWQRQQSKIARLAKDLPIDMAAANQFYDPQYPRYPQYEHQPPLTAKSLPNMELMAAPSIAASSDVLGPEPSPNFYLSDLKLNELNIHDPQENVRQYLYSEMEPTNDAMEYPLNAMPNCPIEREISQSVPPNMNFGRNHHVMTDPITRPASTTAENHRQKYSSIGSSIQTLEPVKEIVQPIDTLEDLNASQNGPSGDITHSGWMKKRKKTRILKHEWEPHHFTLKGTRLAMFEDEEASRRESKALEHIDVDDYAVACSSLASRSKLASALKETVFKRKNTTQDDTAFAFSLLPASKDGSTIEKKNFFANNGKSHHFAVNTSDERIDWMRELMLAKALKREKENGNSVQINGNFF